MNSHSSGKAAHDRYLSGKRILPAESNAANRWPTSLTARCWPTTAAAPRGVQLFARKMLEADVTVGMSLSGALTPAGLGASCIVPLIEAGFVDWIVSTGPISITTCTSPFNCKLVAGDFRSNDTALYEAGVVRIYDVLLSRDECLLATDQHLRTILYQPNSRKRWAPPNCTTCWAAIARRPRKRPVCPMFRCSRRPYRAEVPVYTSSPGDSTIGLELAAIRLGNSRCGLDPILDVNETAGIFFGAKQGGGSRL